MCCCLPTERRVLDGTKQRWRVQRLSRWAFLGVPRQGASQWLISRDAGKSRSIRAGLRSILSQVRHFLFALSLYKNVFASEIRSLVPRILFRMQRKLDGRGIEFGFALQSRPNGHLELNTRTHSRIRDTQSLLANYPWATLVDLHLFLEGWDKGEKSGTEVMSSSCRPQTERARES